MGCSWQSPNDEQAAAAAVPASADPAAVDLASVAAEGKAREICDDAVYLAAAGPKIPADSARGINPALQLFSSAIPSILHCIRLAGDAP